MRNMLLASAAAPALLYALPTQAQNCTAAPDCATLGYTKTASQCSGKTYTRCPFDTSKYSCDSAATVSCSDQGYFDRKEYCPGDYITCPTNENAVRCLLDAKPGDLKYSLRTKDHDGWLLCNGSTYDPNEYPELFTAIGDIFGKQRPNYSGYFLKGAATSSQSTFKTAEQDSLPNIKGAFNARQLYDAVYFASGALMSGGASSTVTPDSSGDQSQSGISFDASKSSSVYGRNGNSGNTGKVIPRNYQANIFIFAGRKMSGYSVCEKQGYLSSNIKGQSCDTVKVGNTTCYKDCVSSLWNACVDKYPITSMMCYGVEYDDCGTDKSYYSERDLDEVCVVFEGSLASSCTFDEQCLSSQYGI